MCIIQLANTTIIMLIDHKAVFSKDHFKYVFVLTALAWLTFTSPAMQAVMAG
ncbi:MAG: hypothetical protein KBC33_00915 [Candidatus Pacebacteria bacterium]|nr:hypothetical protein [Candidatus Paceibacterota bacterium]